MKSMAKALVPILLLCALIATMIACDTDPLDGTGTSATTTQSTQTPETSDPLESTTSPSFGDLFPGAETTATTKTTETSQTTATAGTSATTVPPETTGPLETDETAETTSQGSWSMGGANTETGWGDLQ